MKKDPLIPSEFAEQAALFRWAALMRGKMPELYLLNGSLNGVRINIGQAKKMKQIGMKAGYPDVFLPVKREPYSGLYIELKRVKGGTVSGEQKGWLAALEDQGFKAVVCKGFDEARAMIEGYLK